MYEIGGILGCFVAHPAGPISVCVCVLASVLFEALCIGRFWYPAQTYCFVYPLTGLFFKKKSMLNHVFIN